MRQVRCDGGGGRGFGLGFGLRFGAHGSARARRFLGFGAGFVTLRVAVASWAVRAAVMAAVCDLKMRPLPGPGVWDGGLSVASGRHCVIFELVERRCTKEVSLWAEREKKEGMEERKRETV